MGETDRPTLSIIVPALNEAQNLDPCIREVAATLPPSLPREILIFNDGSTDATGAVAETLAREFPFVRVFHNRTPMGLGYNYAKGVAQASGEFVMMIPGDNETRMSSLRPAFEKLGSYDILIPYTANPHVRPWMRRILSRFFTALCNLAFGLRVRYFNGPCIHRTALLRQISIDTSGFAYMLQILVRLLKSGATYAHIPMELRSRTYGSSKAFSLRNMVSVVKAFFSLIGEVYFRRKRVRLNRP